MSLKGVWHNIKQRSIEFYQNKNLLLYLFFVGVATLFWFLHSLGKQYTANIVVDVNYYNFPIDVEPQDNTVKELTLNVSAYGFSLMRIQLKSILYNYKINIDRLKVSKLSEENNLRYDLSVAAIRNEFEHQLGSGIVINSVFPEEVTFNVRKMGVKKLPITSALKMEMKSGYMISEEGLIQPDSVEVRGPAELLDTLKTIYTQEMIIDNISSSFKREVQLQSPNPEIELMKESATVQYEIEEYIDEEIAVFITPLNFPDSVKVTLSPEEVKLKYRTYERAKQRIGRDDFLLVVDYNTINDLSRKLEVQAVHLPKGITKVYMSPRYVNYTITYEK